MKEQINKKNIASLWKKRLFGSSLGSIFLLLLVLGWSWKYPLNPEFQLDATTTSLFFKLSKNWELSDSIELVGNDIRLIGNISASLDGTRLGNVSKLAISSKKEGKTYINKLAVPAGSTIFLYSTNQSYITIEITLPKEASLVTGSLKINDDSELCTKSLEDGSNPKKDTMLPKKGEPCIALASSIIPNIVSFSAGGTSFQINAKPGKAFDLENFIVTHLSFSRKVVSQADKVEFRCGLLDGTLFVTDILEERKLYKQTCLKLRDAQAETNILWDIDRANVKVVGRATIEPPQLLPSMFYYFWKLPTVTFLKDLALGFIGIFITIWGFILSWVSIFGEKKS